MKIRAVLVAAVLGLASSAAAEDALVFEDVDLPVGAGASEPFLYGTRDGRLLMSWIESSGRSASVKVAALEDGIWSAPSTVAASHDIFVNWADFPSVSEFADGTVIAHWLERSSALTYAYDVRLSLSEDKGETWSAPLTPHGDGTNSQHGFVSLAPFGDAVVAVWLDGRAYGGELVEIGAVSGQMQLRSAVVAPDGALTPDTAIDVSTCSCCQTSATVVGDALLVAYRDRSESEIRDISLVRLHDGRWSAPMRVHEDNWEIPGCPVNGPSIAARDQAVVIAWFTGADDVPAIKATFSGDAGATFEDAVRIDQGQPIGRVDALMLNDGSALISWLEWDGSDEVLMICRVTAEGCAQSKRLAVNSENNSINFPRMAATSAGVFIAWTQPSPGGHDTIRLMISR